MASACSNGFIDTPGYSYVQGDWGAGTIYNMEVGDFDACKQACAAHATCMAFVTWEEVNYLSYLGVGDPTVFKCRGSDAIATSPEQDSEKTGGRCDPTPAGQCRTLVRPVACPKLLTCTSYFPSTPAPPVSLLS